MCVCTRKPGYDTSLTDAQWAVIEPLLTRRDPRRGGRPLTFPRRLILDTVLYALGTGCAWRLVPHDPAIWDAAYRWFRAWAADGTWDRIHDAPQERVRAADGRDPQPSAAVLDSQSVRTHSGGETVGYEAGKRVRGRKRHLLVDTCGRWCTPHRSRPGRSQAGAHRRPPALSAVGAGVGGRRVRQRRRRPAGGLGRPGRERRAGGRAAHRGRERSRYRPADGWWSGHVSGRDGAEGWPGATSTRPRTPKR